MVSMDGRRGHWAPRDASGNVSGNANSAGAVGVAGGENAMTIPEVVWWFAQRVDRSSKDPAEVGEGPFGDRGGRVQPRAADIEGFHFR